MRAPVVALICLCSALGAAAASYFLFSTQGARPQAPATPAPALVAEHQDTAPLTPAFDPSPLQAELAALKAEMAALQQRVEAAEARAAVTPPPATPLPETAVEAEPDAAEKARMAELDRRLAEIETGETAARALREQAVRDLAGQDKDRRDAAVDLLAALARTGDAAARQALTDALLSKDEAARLAALEAMGDSGVAEFLPALTGAAKDGSANARAAVADALGKLPADQAGPLLLDMLADGDARVVRRALDSLGDLKYAPAQAEAMRLSRGSDESVAMEASLTLRRLGDNTAAEYWVGVLGSRVNSSDPKERLNAVKQLRRYKLESTRPYLEQASRDSDAGVRAEAAKGLKALK
ncbi:MAG: HEAT repeat domain-containing protein [Planctomycetes bacterium]|nr:HEAT repeat domain-containing protein [Planctomycetota bacterium]